MLLLVLAYPLLTHAAVWLKEPLLQWAALTVLIAISVYDALKKLRVWAWVLLPTLSVAFLGLVMFGGGMYALFLQPILLPAAMFILFSRSLRPGATPIITLFAARIRGSLPDDLALYTRKLTFWWCVAFALLASSALTLAIFASHTAWSLMTNFVHYLFLGAIFLFEYLYRRYRFRHLEHPGFFAYVRSLFSVRMHSL